jgi:DNA-binding response OmpR family regulator
MKVRKPSKAGEPPYPLLQSQSIPAHPILVVDDDILMRQLSTEMLVQSGYEVDEAADGAAGWEALQSKRYSLLITDNFMPKLTGVEIINLLNAANMDLPVIMATGRVPKEEFNRHPWLQSAAMLVKPFTCSELLATVKKALRATNSSRQGSASPETWHNQSLAGG